MSTGRISEPYRFSIGLFELIVLQLGYAPTDFLQLNASIAPSYYSFGAKVEILKPSGLFQGLAMGADFGFSPDETIGNGELRWYALSASFGNERIQFHTASVVSYSPNQYEDIRIPTSVQIGLSYTVDPKQQRPTKFIAEAWWPGTNERSSLEPSFAVIGLRNYGPTFVGELAFIIGPTLCFGHCSSASRKAVYYPYFSLMWFI